MEVVRSKRSRDYEEEEDYPESKAATLSAPPILGMGPSPTGRWWMDIKDSRFATQRELDRYNESQQKFENKIIDAVNAEKPKKAERLRERMRDKKEAFQLRMYEKREKSKLTKVGKKIQKARGGSSFVNVGKAAKELQEKLGVKPAPYRALKKRRAAGRDRILKTLSEGKNVQVASIYINPLNRYDYDMHKSFMKNGRESAAVITSELSKFTGILNENFHPTNTVLL